MFSHFCLSCDAGKLCTPLLFESCYQELTPQNFSPPSVSEEPQKSSERQPQSSKNCHGKEKELWLEENKAKDDGRKTTESKYEGENKFGYFT